MFGILGQGGDGLRVCWVCEVDDRLFQVCMGGGKVEDR